MKFIREMISFIVTKRFHNDQEVRNGYINAFKIRTDKSDEND